MHRDHPAQVRSPQMRSGILQDVPLANFDSGLKHRPLPRVHEISRKMNTSVYAD